jgi:hypothetical protein
MQSNDIDIKVSQEKVEKKVYIAPILYKDILEELTDNSKVPYHNESITAGGWHVGPHS